MSTTTNYSFNIAEGTDTVNLLTQCYPNFTSLDSILKEIDDNDVTVASETKSGTVHQLARSKANRNVIRFTATSNFTLGDTFTVDGSPVTAVTVAGTALQTGDFVINSNVIAILNGALLTVYAGGSAPTPAAADVSYDNSGSGLTATDVQAAIDEVLADIPTGFAAAAITYDNSGSGLSATDAQNAIDELAAAITPAGSVSVTADGVKTYATLLNELYLLIDRSKLTKDSCIITDTNGDKAYHKLVQNWSTELHFANCWMSSNDSYIDNYQLKSGASTAKYSKNAATAVTRTNAPAVGVTFTLVY